MIYLSKEDLITDSFERFINESSLDSPNVLGDWEKRAIDLVKSMIGSRYDTAKIFNVNGPIRNEVLVSIISVIVVYKLIRRNSARKVPTDLKENYDDEMKRLEKISVGAIKLDDLPKPTDGQGNALSNSIWGNNSNKDFYL